MERGWRKELREQRAGEVLIQRLHEYDYKWWNKTLIFRDICTFIDFEKVCDFYSLDIFLTSFIAEEFVVVIFLYLK